MQVAALGLLAVLVLLAVSLLSSRPSPSGSPLSRPIVLVVLPFANLSGDPAQEFFSDGLTDETITLLGEQSLQGVSVVARTSVMQYRDMQESLTQIAQELGVADYVLRGSVRRFGLHVAINAQLFRVQDQSVLWAQTYENETADVVAMQEDVAERISQSLLLKLTPTDHDGKPSAGVDPIVHDAYLMGLYEANKRTADGLRSSINYFQQAVKKDPQYAPAYAGLANSYLLAAGWLTLKPADAYPKAKAAALRALELDESLAEAHTALAESEHEYDWKWAEAEREFQRAIKLNPSSASAHKSYAEFLMRAGRNEEAISEIERARDLDPLSLIVPSLAGFVYTRAGQPSRAVQECERVIELDPQFAPAHYFLGGALMAERRFDEAIAQFKKATDLSNGASMMATALAGAYAISGRRKDAQHELSRLEQNAKRLYVSPYGLAQVYAALGEKRRALDALERAAEEHSFELVFLGIDSRFESLHDNPRFLQLVSKIGFPDAPVQHLRSGLARPFDSN
jgi:TolB-like protein/tetratricopeptide (TPR) repeat protein